MARQAEQRSLAATLAGRASNGRHVLLHLAACFIADRSSGSCASSLVPWSQATQEHARDQGPASRASLAVQHATTVTVATACANSRQGRQPVSSLCLPLSLSHSNGRELTGLPGWSWWWCWWWMLAACCELFFYPLSRLRPLCPVFRPPFGTVLD